MVNPYKIEDGIHKIAEITRRHRKAQGLTLAKFGELMAERLPYALSRQAVNRWESGRIPELQLLRGAVASYGDWRQEWALECLAVLLPGVTIGGQS